LPVPDRPGPDRRVPDPLIRRGWVSVPVATVWNQPASTRPEDGPAVGSHPDVAAWLSGIDDQEKLGLDDLLATQALLYQPLIVFGVDRGWYHVLVAGQTGSVYPFGVAGWVPADQVSLTPPPEAGLEATVAVPRLEVGGLTLSYGTTLPAEAATGRSMTVAVPTGWFPVAATELRTTPLNSSGGTVVAEAERFVGLPYLWAGTSGFGFDCSGLTYSVYRQFGIALARDAADQARQGRPVAPADLERGDLVFFAFGASIDHVGIYAGGGMMVDSPHTGASVEVVPLWSRSFAPYFAGARRFL
jgi:cell wall-associated NlpC family hydrolase